VTPCGNIVGGECKVARAIKSGQEIDLSGVQRPDCRFIWNSRRIPILLVSGWPWLSGLHHATPALIVRKMMMQLV
jgi:hypothetical protein